MSIRMFKALLSSLILVLSFLLSSCGEGERKLITIEAEPEEEPSVPMVVHTGGVKGPLANAKVSVYKVDLNAPDYERHVSALQGFYRLLDEHGITLENDQVEFTPPAGRPEIATPEQALASIKLQIEQSGYVSQLPILKHVLLPKGRDDAAHSRTVAQATLILRDYLGEIDYPDLPLVDETNSLQRDAVLAVISGHATVKDLYSQIDALPTLLSESKDANSLSAVAGLITKYRARESDEAKLAGFERISQRINQLNPTTMSGLLSALRDIQDSPHQLRSGETEAACGDFAGDSVAVHQLSELIDHVADAETMQEAESVLQEGWRKEGNPTLKACLNTTLVTLINVNDAIELIAGDEALYLLRHDLGASVINDASSLDELVTIVQTALGERARSAIESALISKHDKRVTLFSLTTGQPFVANRPANFLKEGQTDARARIEMDFEDYQGLVYMVVESAQNTVDINTQQAAVFPVLETIFDTEDILGYGDNNQESLLRYFLIDGQKVRDVEGNLIQDEEKLPTLPSGQEALEIFPARYATPLTSLSVALFKESLTEPEHVYDFYRSSQVQGQAGLQRFKLDHLLFQDALDDISDKVWRVFGDDALNGSLFNVLPVFSREMEFDRSAQINAARYRTYSENFSALVKQMSEDLRLPAQQVFSVLAEDLIDGELDQKRFDTVITQTSRYEELFTLAKRHPEVVSLPGTTFNADDSLHLMKSELSQLEPEATPGEFDVRISELTLDAPAAGIDTDGDDVFDNSDEFPQDETRQYDLPNNHQGLWSVRFDPSLPVIMPFHGSTSVEFFRHDLNGTCPSAPCFSVGQALIPVSTRWVVIRKPANSDIQVTGFGSTGNVGVRIQASTPGDYLLKGEFSTEDPESRSFTVEIPLTIIDPRSIQLRFSPENPDVGQAIAVDFKVTDELCRLYTFCADLIRDDLIDDFLPIELLGGNFSVIWQVDGEEGQFRQVQSQNNGTTLVSDLSSKYGDDVRVRVVFNSPFSQFTLGSRQDTAGHDLDYDGDGTVNHLDEFPNDAACSRKDEGTVGPADPDNPGRIVSQCNDTLISNSEGIRTFAVPFASEIWLAHSSWGQLLRVQERDPATDLYLPPIFFNSLKNNPFGENADDPVSPTNTLRGLGAAPVGVSPDNRRIYFVLDDKELVYFDYDKGNLYKFWQSDNATTTITDVVIVRRFVVVGVNEGGIQRYILLNDLGKVPEIKTAPFYPDPGHAISPLIDSRSMNLLADNFSFAWLIERSDGNEGVESVPAVTSDDGMMLLPGQTQYGDRVTLTLSAVISGVQQNVMVQRFYVLGAKGFKFKKNITDVGDTIEVMMDEADLESKPDINAIAVKWYKNGIAEENFDRLIFTDNSFPYQLSPNRINQSGQAAFPEYGDIITAEVVFNLGAEVTTLKRMITVVIGDPSNLQLTRDEEVFIEKNGRKLQISVDFNRISKNDEFLRRFFYSPVWISEERNAPLPGSDATEFPSLETEALRYGDTLVLQLQYEIGDLKGLNDSAFEYALEFDEGTSEFNISPKVPGEGVDLSLDLSEYVVDSLEDYEPRWVINGVVDPTINSFREPYPANKLQYGDHVQLYIDRKGSDSELGFTHLAEVYVGLNLGDGRNNRNLDRDSDLDGISNRNDYLRSDAECSGVDEGNPDDRDSDGIPDLVELGLGTNPNKLDTDGDGLSDDVEQRVGSSLLLVDTDGDGYTDAHEYAAGTNPSDASSPGFGVIDQDRDGLPDETELLLGLFVNRQDSDGDGLWDGFEFVDIESIPPSFLQILATDIDADSIPDVIDFDSDDSDNDRIPDLLEALIATYRNTDSPEYLAWNGFDRMYSRGPGFTKLMENMFKDSDGDDIPDVLDSDSVDSDNDGISDLLETNISIFPLASILIDTDDDGIKDVLDSDSVDSDNDGVSDLLEMVIASLRDTDGDGIPNLRDPDSDNDGLSDGAEFHVTKTNRLIKDSDSDSADLNSDGVIDVQLNDGVEVLLTRTNPADVDTDDDGLDDARDEEAAGVGDFPPGLILGISDLTEYEFDEATRSVPQGSCYSSWLGRQDNDFSIVATEYPQLDDDDQQRLLFSHRSWNEVLVFDANQNKFIASIFEPGVTQNVTAVAFDAESINRIYLGYADGTVKRLDRGVPNERDQDRPVFNLGERLEILGIKSKSGILLVETTDPENADGYRHYMFNANNPTAAPVFITSTASYSTAIWSDASNRNSLLMVNAETGDIFEENIPINPPDPDDFDQDLLGTSPSAELPEIFYLDVMSGVPSLRFADGQQFNLSTNGWMDGDIFGLGLNHQDHRIETSFDNTQISLRYGIGDTSWSQITQPGRDTSIRLVPAGRDVLIISRNLSSSSVAALGFDILVVGDSDEDGLPGWWEAVMGTSDASPVSDAGIQVPGDALGRTYFAIFSAGRYPDLGFDGDGDRISDARERELGTDVTLPDTDADGLTDFAEIHLWSTDPLKSDTDGDGLTDSEELVLGTNPLLADSDGDGLSDGYERNFLRTDPLLMDTDDDAVNDGDEDNDSDGLSNRQELALTQTDPIKTDTDGDGIDDGDEDFDRDGLTNIQEITGPIATDPTNQDTDGDDLTDFQEIRNTLTNPTLPDSDGDGITDGMEDRDGDGLSDFVELNRTFTAINETDTDDDGTPDNLEDFDSDGWTNEAELEYGFRPDRDDTDGDGIGDAKEDRDNDGLPDWVEIYSTFTSHESADDDLDDVLDGDEDPDGDGLTNIDEAFYGTCPIVNAYVSKQIDDDLGACANPADTDQDDINDYEEVITLGTSPFNNDTDSDSLSDYEEAIAGFDVVITDLSGNPVGTVHMFSDPTSVDGDSDGLPDLLELGNQIYPEQDGDSNDESLKNRYLRAQVWQSNPLQKDTDGDGLTDKQEFDFQFKTTFALPRTVDVVPGRWLNPNVEDTDSDGLSDQDEVLTHRTNPSESDTDFDGINDFDEIHQTFGYATESRTFDTDSDGLNDGNEVTTVNGFPPTGTNPLNQDTDVDIVWDGNEDSDGDGLTDSQEFYFTLTRFDLSDSDGDGITDADEDPDQDGLTNLQELTLGTDPLVADTDGDGLSDGDEVNEHQTNPLAMDTDRDGATDFNELRPSDSDDPDSISISDPTNPDTDDDGANDSQDSAPRDPDQDFDLILDGIDGADGSTNDDIDDDGLLDGFELRLGTFDENGGGSQDTDGDGLLDPHEVWVFALNADGSVYSHGPDTNGDLVPDEVVFVLNSRPDYMPPWPVCPDPDVCEYESIHLGADLERLLRNSNTDSDAQQPDVTLYIRRFSDPTLDDSDDDGLTDFTEVNRLSLVDLTEIAPSTPNRDLFLVSDPMNPDTNGDGLNDGQEDFDGDYLNNFAEQQDDRANIRLRDADNDLLPDGIEVLVFDTDPSLADTDEDGINDNGDGDCGNLDGEACFVEARDRRPLGSGEQCNDTEVRNNAEIRLSNIAGANYCVTIHLRSLPIEPDSDFDGVGDLDDHYPMDQACSDVRDGFGVQCFATWMADQPELSLIRSLNDSGEQIYEAGFYGQGWDKLVRYNYLEGHYLPSVEITETLVDFAYNSSMHYLYLLNENGDISRVDLNTAGDDPDPDPVGNVSDGEVPEAVKVLSDGRLLVQTRNSTTLSHTLRVYQVINGELQHIQDSAITNVVFDLRDGYYDAGSNRFYALGKVTPLSEYLDIGYVVFNPVTGRLTDPVFSGTTFPREPRGPIVKEASGHILTGSGYRFDTELLRQLDWTIQSGNRQNRQFTNFRHYLANAGHETIVVDFPVGSSSTGPGRDGLSNGLLVVGAPEAGLCDTARNKYLNPLHVPDNKILALLETTGAAPVEHETFTVVKTDQVVNILPMGLASDADDEDGMSSIYETYYRLDPFDATDKFGDPDGDTLTNIEEFECATDPLSRDSDLDTWLDHIEVLNGSSPTDPNDY